MLFLCGIIDFPALILIDVKFAFIFDVLLNPFILAYSLVEVPSLFQKYTL